MADPYALLGVSPSASKAEIKAAFRKKALLHHPDLHSGAPENVQKAHDAAFKALNEAYQALMDGTHRSRQRGGHSGFARGQRYGAASASAGADYNPFGTYYRSGTGGSYWGWRQYQRRRSMDLQGLFRSLASLSKATAAASLGLGALLVGGTLMLDPAAASLWEQNNKGKLFSSIEEDVRRRRQQQQQQQAKQQQQQATSAGAAAAAAAVAAGSHGGRGQQGDALGGTADGWAAAAPDAATAHAQATAGVDPEPGRDTQPGPPPPLTAQLTAQRHPPDSQTGPSLQTPPAASSAGASAQQAGPQPPHAEAPAASSRGSQGPPA